MSSLSHFHNLSVDSTSAENKLSDAANTSTGSTDQKVIRPRHMGTACGCIRPQSPHPMDGQTRPAVSLEETYSNGQVIHTTRAAVCDKKESSTVMTPRRTIRNRLWSNIKSQISMPNCSAPKRARPSRCGERISSTVVQKEDELAQGIEDVTPQQEAENLTNADNDGDFVTFRLLVHLKCGRGLIIRDASGCSDPYVKVKYRKKTIYKSNTIYRNLNPIWDEEFALLIDDPTFELQFEVFDFDRFMADDFMGSATVDLSLLRLFDSHEVSLKLEEAGNSEKMGYLECVITITPLTEIQQTQFLARAVRGIIAVSPKRPNRSSSVWLSIVNVVLVEARLKESSQTKQSAEPPDCYVKFKLGNEKHKSKIAAKSFNPKWSEQFDLHVFDECVPPLNVMIYDKSVNTIIGRCSVALGDREKERTVESWHQLEDGNGEILLLITISGTSSAAAVVDLQEYSANRDKILQKYSLLRSLHCLRDVGYLIVKVSLHNVVSATVYRAEGVAAGDANGKSDPFCVLELVNVRLQTQTVYKTLNPEWNKLFTFAVKDIHECLEVTVFDEDPNKKFEFLGRVIIPLLKIRNCEKRWYSLRDRKLAIPAKGRILLELDLLWNPMKAALRTFNPRERKFIAPEPKFKRQLLVGSVNRLREFGQQVVAVGDFYQRCLSWESYRLSLITLMAFVLFVYFVELWHFPLILLTTFLYFHFRCRNAVRVIESTVMTTSFNQETNSLPSTSTFYDQDANADSNDDITQPGNKNSPNSSPAVTPGSDTVPPTKIPAEKSSIRTRVIAIQETLTLVQTSLDFVASLLERVRNTLHFKVPFLSWLAVAVLSAATALLFFVPLRWIVVVWGVNKFSKRLLNPHYVDNNELLDFLSRVPSDAEFRMLYHDLHRSSSLALENGAPKRSTESGKGAVTAAENSQNESNSSLRKKNV